MQSEQGVADGQNGDSQGQGLGHGGDEDKQKIEIRVNGKKVEMIGREQTGLAIKAAAIAQHVNIQLDFLLYLLREHQPNQPVGDNEMIKISDDSRFHAIADDDNS